MKKIKYALLGEGIAEYEFIPAYLKKIGDFLEFDIQRNRKLQLNNPNKSEVLKNAQNFCIRSLSDHGDQLFIVGVDLDQTDYLPELEKFISEKKVVERAIGKDYKQFQDRVVIFVPIQAIDCWLLYQHYRLTNSKKPPPNSLESLPKDEVKHKVYSKNDGQHIRKISLQIAEKADFDELAKQSASFSDFHSQVKTFLASLRPTT